MLPSVPSELGGGAGRAGELRDSYGAGDAESPRAESNGEGGTTAGEKLIDVDKITISDEMTHRSHP